MKAIIPSLRGLLWILLPAILTAIATVLLLSALEFLPWILGAIVGVQSFVYIEVGRRMERKDREKNVRVINIDNLTPEERQEVQNILLGKVNSTNE